MEVKGVQAIERILDIIEYLALKKNHVSITEISQKLSLHKSTVHRLLNALLARGYI